MTSHYLTIAIRNFRNSPFLTIVNILTLALGLVCFVTAYAVVSYWDHSEQHFENADRTYVVTSKFSSPDGEESNSVMSGTNEFLAEYLRVDFPEIEVVARVNMMNETTMIGTGERALRVFGISADPEFLDIFEMSYISRVGENPLRQRRSIVLTEDTARRLFGDEDPMGRVLILGNVVDATVTGVIENVTEPSHLGRSASSPLRFELLSSRDVLEAIQDIADPNRATRPENWLNISTITYVMLPEQGTLTSQSLNDSLADFALRHVPERQAAEATIEFGTIPVSDLTLNRLNTIVFSQLEGVSITTVLFVLGGLVLGVACINYANLATARAAGRSREVGLRKVLGAKDGQIIWQNLVEVGLLTMGALGIGLMSLLLIIPRIQDALGINLSVTLFSGPAFWLFLLALVMAVTVIAGTFPAFVLSRVRPVEAMRLNPKRSGPRFVSTLLVGLQFAVASFLLIAVLVMSGQNAELRRTGLGSDTDPLLYVESISRMTGIEPEALRERFLRLPQVTSVTSIGNRPWTMNDWRIGISRSLGEDAVTYNSNFALVSFDYFSTLEIPTLAGRTFSRDTTDGERLWGRSWDAEQPINVVVDRAFAEELGFESPQGAIGSLVYLPEWRPLDRAAQPLQIVGVVENRTMHFMGQAAEATMYTMGYDLPSQILRISRDDIPGALAAIDEIWRGLAPNVSVNRRFVDELFEETYENFGRVSQTFSWLALFAFLISTVGLFAMAIQVASRRVQEIGIRKTLGANATQLVVMLLRDFSIPVVIGSLIAWPIAYIAASAYLNAFLQPISLTALPFIISLVITLLVAWGAVAGQAYRAAQVLPAKVLRHE